MTAEDLIYKLYFFFNVNNNLDLADKMKTTPQTISNWKSRNSVNAINKKCRELGIYNEIFGDSHLNSNIQIIDKISGGNNSQLNYGNQINNKISGGNNSQLNYGNQINNKISDIDDATLILLKEAYQKAIENDDLNGLRRHLMEYS